MIRKKRLATFALAAGLSLATPFFTEDAGARPGGGQTFGGSSRSSSSSSSSSGRSSSSSSWSSRSSGSSGSSSSSSGGSTSGPTGPVSFVLMLFGLVFVVANIVLKHAKKGGGWESSFPSADDELRERMWAAGQKHEREKKQAAERAKKKRTITAALAELRSTDTEFSLVLFEDFLYSLYAETQAARGRGTLDALGAYLTEKAREAYAPFPAKEVRDVVIGAMTFTKVRAQEKPSRRVELDVRFEVNLTEVDDDGAEQSYWVAEIWHLVRGANVKSRPREKTRLLGCPNCGAPLDKAIGAKCGYCGVVASPGELDWTVTSIETEKREPRGPMLTGTTEEVGTDDPTIIAPDAKAKLDALKQKDPAFRWSTFSARIGKVFAAFHEAWSTQNLAIARPYLSDNLFQFQKYWIETYQKQGLRNVTEEPHITALDLARVASDKHFDAITVRVFASCIDYTIDEKGRVVSGTRTKERDYSEYWTFIRGAERRGEPRVDPVCPNCGAPNTEINMAGTCGHCKAHVTSGEFDWVLSRIEQDETYEGSA